MKQFKKYFKEYYVALRVMSLSLALAATTFGIIAAFRQGYITEDQSFYNSILILIITIAGIASQAGANLVNDYFEGSFKYVNHSKKTVEFFGKVRSYFDVFVFLSGIAALGLAGLIGLYLVYLTDYYMLIIGLLGLIGSYAYTGEPFVYKRKGLGVPLSFILMGPLMLLGAYYPFAKQLDWYPILLGLPVSMFVPAMMLSNEMRDYKRDKRLVMGTLSVKLGSRLSLLLYDFLLFGAFILTGVYIIIGLYPVQAAISFVLLPKAFVAHKSVKNFHRLSIQNTNKIHLYYFIIVSIVLVIWS
jgi:1,4-dihydroxy-2-naphthoate octaprenyltransferase